MTRRERPALKDERNKTENVLNLQKPPTRWFLFLYSFIDIFINYDIILNMCSLHERSQPHKDKESRLLELLIKLLGVVLFFTVIWTLCSVTRDTAEKINKPAVVSAEKQQPIGR